MAEGSQDILDSIPSFTESGTPSGAPGAPAGGEGAVSDKTPAAPAAGAQSGEAQPPKTALEAAERVMAGRTEASPASKQPQDGKPQDGKATTDPKAAADAALPFKDHPRWKEVTSELRILRVAKEKNETAIKELEPKAGTYDDLTSFLGDNNLSKDDFAAMLSIASAIRNSPLEAYEMLKPIMERLEAVAGERLPPDLQQLVEAGKMDPEAAKITARTRSEAAIAKGRMEDMGRRSAESQEAQQRREAEERTDGVVKDIVAYVDTWASRDPDAEAKRPLVEQAIELELRRLDAQRKSPSTPEEIRAIVDGAVKEANNVLRTFAPRPRPSAGHLPSGDSPPNAAPVPKSSLEAAQLALSRGATG